MYVAAQSPAHGRHSMAAAEWADAWMHGQAFPEGGSASAEVPKRKNSDCELERGAVQSGHRMLTN